MEYKISIKVRSSDKKELPDWGLGPGILSTQEIELGTSKSSDKIELLLALEENGKRLLEETVEVLYEEL